MPPRHHEDSVYIDARPEQVFAFVDDHARFSSHMSESSWMMAGARMSIEVDEAKGQAVGSHIRLAGRICGIPLSLDEVVTRRVAPLDKVWETVGTPRLLVIGWYRMGVEVRPVNGGSRLRVFIDFGYPTGRLTYWLGRALGGVYAKWCVRQMLDGASAHVAVQPAAAA